VHVKSRLLGIVLILAISALASLAVACGDSLLPDGVVARVGDVDITEGQLDAAVEREASAYGITKESYPDGYEDFYKSLQDYVLQNLVVNEVATQEAVELSISVSDEEVQTALDGYLTYYDNDQAAFEEELAASGMTIDDVKEDIRGGLLRDKVRTEVVKDVTAVDEEKVTAYYYANLDSYYVEPSREVRHILIKPQASGTESGAELTESDWAAALQTAEHVRSELVAGGDWTELAAQYSDDFSTKDSGGILGTIHTGEQIKEFEDVAFSLELDEVSQPVKTVYGYEIIQATGVTVGGAKDIEEVRAQIEAQLLSEAQDAAWNAWLDQKVAQANVIYRSDLQPEATTTTEAPTTTLPDADSTGSSDSTTTT